MSRPYRALLWEMAVPKALPWANMSRPYRASCDEQLPFLGSIVIPFSQQWGQPQNDLHALEDVHPFADLGLQIIQRRRNQPSVARRAKLRTSHATINAQQAVTKAAQLVKILRKKNHNGHF